MRYMARRGMAGISNQTRDVYLNEREILKIQAPGPDACTTLSVVHAGFQSKSTVIIPRTIINATRYGSGSTRLKRSSVGSTTGSGSDMLKERVQ